MLREEAAPKSALAFILNPPASPWSDDLSDSPTLSPRSRGGSSPEGEDDDDDVAEEGERLSGLHLDASGEPRALLSPDDIMEARVTQLLSSGNHHGKMRVRKASVCAAADCGRAAVSRGRCVRHGGGSRCTYPNCTHGARLYNRCFHHGGCKLCKVAGCTSKAKRYGYCWSHGGGHICDAPGCSKVAAPGGFCWAHGGGNRCKVEGCNRRSYQKHNYFCKQHLASAP